MSSSGICRHENKNKSKERIELPKIVSHWYYKHGLFISSYPTCAISITIILVLFCCYPLVNIPLPGTIPTRVVVSNTYNDDNEIFSQYSENNSKWNTILSGSNLTTIPPFLWANEKPFIYIQQLVIRASVYPWLNELQLTDAFRSPLYEVFKILEILRNHESNEKKTIDHICLHVENTKRPLKDKIFPEYNCLILSPANFWEQSNSLFNKDMNILNTIFQYHKLQKGKISIAEMFLGLPMEETGFRRYPIHSRSRIIQYAITLFLKENDQNFLTTLKKKLSKLYTVQNEQKTTSIIYIYYPGELNIMEFLPIVTAFLVLFLYIYFSIRKIDVIKSRIILALCAVLTALATLMISLSLCFFFGLTISLQSKDMFPYLVILIGLENSLVITKSVITTNETFDVKIRIAKGLSKEGWYIAKTLLTEITILTAGLTTFVPVIQEFCIFAIFGLITDFFIQMLFFSTILALNIKLYDFTVETTQLPKINDYKLINGIKNYTSNFLEMRNYNSTNFIRSRLDQKNSTYKIQTKFSDFNKKTNVNNHNIVKKIPKRLKLVNFWVRTRFFQRAFMIWMSVWIFSIIYNSEYFEKFSNINFNYTKSIKEYNNKNFQEKLTNNKFLSEISNYSIKNSINKNNLFNNTIYLKKLQHPNFDINHLISDYHWQYILSQYNITLRGKYVTILPSIRLTYIIKPESAISLRNPKEKFLRNFQWKALAVALDPLDFNDNINKESDILSPKGIPLYPKSPMEIFLVIILCIISICVLTYTMVVLYRCICTRNYAEWRSSWNNSNIIYKNTEFIFDGTPINIIGHSHKIECLATHGFQIVSTCLEGKIKLWDSKNGELLLNIQRNKITLLNLNENKCKSYHISPIWCMDYVDNLIAIGCANGRLEFWEVPSGNLKCIYDDEKDKQNGITNIHLLGSRVIAARLNGKIDIYKLETYSKGKQIDWEFTSAYRRTNIKRGSPEFSSNSNQGKIQKYEIKEELRCIVEYSKLAHQQPITCMQIFQDILFSGSQDHTLKVYSLHDLSLEQSLNGHFGPISCLFIDRWQPGMGGSGSQDGLLCIWDLLSGACVYTIQAHNGCITSLVCAPSYIITLGTDEQICVWERFQGNLLTKINSTNSYSPLLMYTPSLLFTTKLGSLIVWDVRTGEPTREIKLDTDNIQFCPKFLILAGSSIVCDYGNQLRIVKLPMAIDKYN